MINTYNMKKIFVVFWISQMVWAQKKIDTVAVDSLYREDQIYFLIGYNFFDKKPNDYAQNGFASTVNLGFLRDMPINKSRTWAIAAGLGISYNAIKNNLSILPNLTNNTNTYSITGAKNIHRNIFAELPIEIRWRNSSPTKYRFWRIYPGFKFRYALYNFYKYEDNGQVLKINNNPDFNKLQYGATLTLGNGTFNLHAYYGLQTVFKNQTINTSALQIQPFMLGLQFYIL
jgi:hypothetical protein